MVRASDVLITGSKIGSTSGDLNIVAVNNALITNAVNKAYSFKQSTKKGSLKTSRISKTDYVETAVNSELSGKNINITTNNNIYVQGSNLNSTFDTVTNTGGDTKLTAANDTIISNAILKEYHYNTKEVSNRGLFKGVTAITSALISTTRLGIGILPPEVKKMDHAYHSQYHNTKVRTNNKNDLLNIVASNINVGNNLTITSTNNTTVQASNINSGIADISGTNGDVTGSTIINSNNLNIFAGTSYDTNIEDKRTKRTFAIRNNITGNMVTDYVNSNLTAKNDSFSFNVGNQVALRAKDLTDPTITQPSYVTTLKAQVASDKISETNLVLANKHWEETNRELTETGQAAVAIAAVAATVVTGGAALGFIGTAVAASAAATASTTAVSTSMNAEGDIFKQVKDISKDTWDATTSRAAFENYAIAAGTAFLTAGLMDVSGLNEAGNAANSTANGANAATTTTTSTASTTTAATTSGAVAASNSGVYMQVGKALAESAISTVSSTAAQSAVNGESFSDTIKNQGTNILVGAVSNVGAKHIGMNYKTSAQTGVDKAIQLVFHAGLGAGVSALTGNDALSGAVSGVVGEVGGEFIDKNTNLSNNAIKELAGLAGGYSAIFTGNLVGLSDGEVAGNIFSGSRIGKNAAENNALLLIHGTNSSSEKADPEFINALEDTFNEKVIKLEWSGENTREARIEGAEKMNNMLDGYKYKSGEGLHVIGHSHGGNVFKEFSQIYKGDKKVDTSVFLGTPHRDDHILNYDVLAPNASLINLYDKGDMVQIRGN